MLNAYVVEHAQVRLGSKQQGVSMYVPVQHRKKSELFCWSHKGFEPSNTGAISKARQLLFLRGLGAKVLAYSFIDRQHM